MVSGDGLLATAFSSFREDDRVLIHAAGVSNSMETDPRAFARERARLLEAREAHPDKLLVYFGTCSADDPDRREHPYVAHKLEMEALLEQRARPWMVLRLPLAIGPGRRGRTLAPYLYQRISRGEPFELWEHAVRYPLDVVDAVRIARRFIERPQYWNRRINVVLRAYAVSDFVRIMESIVGRPAACTRVPRGRHFAVDCPELAALAGELELDRTEGYLERVLRKYFSDEADIRPSAGR